MQRSSSSGFQSSARRWRLVSALLRASRGGPRHWAVRACIAVVIGCGSAVLPPGPSARAFTPIYFPATGHNLGAHFKAFWDQKGALATFGYPLSEEFEEGGRPTQYFERAVLTYFRELANTPYEVQLVQLGRAALAGRPSSGAELPVAPFPPADDGYYFPETGHSVRFAFLRQWRQGGGLAIYGYPLTEEFTEVSSVDGRSYTVQYFERARFEFHPEFRGKPHEVQLGLLGWQLARDSGRASSAPFQAVAAPEPVARPVTRGNVARPYVALTFDAGADGGNTARILDTLAVNGIRASFGLTGQWARSNPDLVRRIAAEGHQIINHTDSHRSWTGLSDGATGLDADARVAELDRADRSILQATGGSTRPWFRSPYGDIDAAAMSQLAASGYAYNVLWTVDSLGRQGRSPAEVVNRVAAAAAPGAIVLMHVGASSADADALQATIDAVRERGLGFQTVAEIVAP